MDRRSSWPWKKKPSKRTVKKSVASHTVAASLDCDESQGYQMKTNSIEISMDNIQMAELEDQVKLLNDQVNLLTENLSLAHSEMTTKDDLVNQHARVAEEAVSGWEKAEAEALALKHQLESVTVLKLSADDRASNLDGALKECTRQMRNLNEEHEQKLNESLLIQNNEWDKIKNELQTKINDLDQELLKSSAENAALSRSLQERSDMLTKITEEKSHAVAEVELLKSNIQSREREIGSLNYELHILSKELEIRNEEKNMNLRSAELANKQHIEGVKKVAKLETECQRLRSLVQKKLPGPAALAQMKVEVENMSWGHGEPRMQWSSVSSANPRFASLPELSPANTKEFPRDSHFLIERMSAMEEETKMLKEVLTRRNSELQASRNLCAKTASKLRNYEAQMQGLIQQISSEKSSREILVEGSCTHMSSYPSSVASMSEDGIDGQSSADSKVSCISELSQFKKEKNINKANKAGNKNQLELMDDFLEMERLACLSSESNVSGSVTKSLVDKRTENEDQKTVADDEKHGDFSTEKQSDLDPSEKYISSNKKLSARRLEFDMDQAAWSELQSRISIIIDSQAKDIDMGRLLQDIKYLVQNIQESQPQHSISCVSDATHSPDVTSKQKTCPLDTMEPVESETCLTLDSKPSDNTEHTINPKFVTSVCQIHDFVKSLGKEAIAVQDKSFNGHGTSRLIEGFSDSVDKVICSQMSVLDFVLELSHVLAEASELNIRVPGYKSIERETNSSDCIDNVNLLENEVTLEDPLRNTYPNGCAHVCRSTSDHETLREGPFCSGDKMKDASWKCLLEEFEQLKSEKHNVERDLARCIEALESTRFQLQQTEQLLADLKLQLASSKKSNSLTETQLKCMVESYKSLEKREQDLQAEVNLLRGKTETLDNELQEEKWKHQGALDKCKDLQEQIQRNECCSIFSRTSTINVDIKSKQDRDIIAAAQKLAECQENIFLLDRQLKALHPPIEFMRSPNNARHQRSEALMGYDSEMETVIHREGECGESPSYVFDTSLSSSEAEEAILRSTNSPKSPILRHTKSFSSTMSSILTSEKRGLGFSRFFSSKPRSGQ